jgi:hypothetical protein
VSNASESSGEQLGGLDEQLFKDPMLLLPKLWLPYGLYSVELKVSMSDTIVHASTKTTFEVYPVH